MSKCNRAKKKTYGIKHDERERETKVKGLKIALTWLCPYMQLLYLPRPLKTELKVRHLFYVYIYILYTIYILYIICIYILYNDMKV